MKKIPLKQILIVEGKYDKAKLAEVFDAVIIETGGFRIFGDEKKQRLIKTLAAQRGAVIFTDGDGAGFVIRNYLKNICAGSSLCHAYIPDRFGKERRKKTASKEGKLGVEGFDAAELAKAVISAGAEKGGAPARIFDKAAFYRMGLSGAKDSREKRERIARRYGLPERMTANALIDFLNAAEIEEKEVVENAF